MADAYREAIGGSLKLKSGVKDGGIKKKKKKKKLDKESIEAEFGAPTTDIDKKNSQATTSSKEIRPKTDAEKAFERVQRERQVERILKKASKSHKQRVEEFNNHLDSLSEHYDVPKVSWTK